MPACTGSRCHWSSRRSRSGDLVVLARRILGAVAGPNLAAGPATCCAEFAGAYAALAVVALARCDGLVIRFSAAVLPTAAGRRRLGEIAVQPCSSSPCWRPPSSTGDEPC
jgi:hypothetical protein